MTFVLILIVLVVVVAASASAVTVTRRRRGPELNRRPPVHGPAGRDQWPPRRPKSSWRPTRSARSKRRCGREVEAPPPPLRRSPARDRLGKARTLFAGYLASVRSRGRSTTRPGRSWRRRSSSPTSASDDDALLDHLREPVQTGGHHRPGGAGRPLKADLIDRLAGDRELHFEADAVNVWLFVGVNGVGKTTTIGKLGPSCRRRALVVMAAGDTFRAAAADQLALWAARVGADLSAARRAATPGRWSSTPCSMRRPAHRPGPGRHRRPAAHQDQPHGGAEEGAPGGRTGARNPSEVLLVIDATTGQNGLIQAKEFAAAVGVTGVVLTKLDGTAKGGIALAIQTELGIPIKLVGLGEGAEDLVSFDAQEFVDALFSQCGEARPGGCPSRGPGAVAAVR